MSKVIIVPCSTYDREQVYTAMKQGIEALGGIESFVKKDEKILVKPNFLSYAEPEKAVTTHPAVIEAMLRILYEDGYDKVTFGDSPGHGSCQSVSDKLGLESPIQKWNATMADMSTEVHRDFPEGMTAKEFWFSKGVTEADAIINLCKMKTHALERITGAVKNVYGFICGYRKGLGHVLYPNCTVFARMLGDIHRATDIRLNIMDAVVAMEGNGPGSGDPVPMKMLLFSDDPVALDSTFCHLIDLDPKLVPTCTEGEKMGIGTCSDEQIQIVVCENNELREISPEQLLAKYGKADFNVDRQKIKVTVLDRFASFTKILGKRPRIDEKLCVKCGVCVDHCPVPGKAVEFRRGKSTHPSYDYKKCIRCYCCQEMCPKHAIYVK